MNSTARNLKIYEGGLGGCLAEQDLLTKQPTKQPLNNLQKWIDSADLEILAGISQQASNKALRASVWRGAHLDVREIASNVGRGGKMLQVHVDSLPLDLRERWYLSKGIDVTLKPETGALVAIDPKHEDKINDATYQKQYKLAVFKHNLIKPIVSAEDCHERAKRIEDLASREIVMPNGKTKRLTKATIYNWIKAYKDEGALSALMRKPKADRGKARVLVTRAWDGFFGGHIDDALIQDVADEITTYIRSMWAAGSAGKHAIAEHSTTKLIEISRDLGVVAFERLELGNPSDKTSAFTQFGVCHVNARRVENEKAYAMIKVKDKDNRAFQDHHVPTARRDYSSLKPRQIIVGDVHPVDIMMHRPDGTEVYPKAIAWFDPATNEIHMTFAMLQEGEGIRQEHIAQSFIAMVEEWGMPAVLYLDNGSEYKDSGMLEGLTRLSQLIDGFGVRFLDENNDQVKRAIESREAVIRSTPYNAKGKPKIEGAFGNLEKVFFSAIEGWTGGDRMNRKTHQKGKKPQAFSGDMSEFLETMTKALDWYHKRPQRGMLNGKSPNEALRGFIEGGWTKTVLSRPEVLELAFGKEVERTPDRGRISYKPRRGEALYFYHEQLHWHQKVIVRIADWKPDHAFIFEKGTGKYICTVTPEEAYDVLDPRGAQELARRKKAFNRTISEKRKNTALLSLVDEMERHASHLPDAPEAPIGNVIDAGILDRLAEDAANERKRLLEDHQEKAKRKPADQWKTSGVPTDFQFLPEDEDDV